MKRHHPTKPRRTQQLTGTHSKAHAHLDFASALAIEWARRKLSQGGPQVVHLSGVVRRALQFYVHHLDQAEPGSEYRAVANVSKAQPVPEGDQRMAELRLYADPLPSFDVVLHGARAVAEREAFHLRLQSLLEERP